VLLAVSDPAVAEVAREIEAARAVVHVSGSLGLDVLEPQARRGSLHPYQSFPVERPPEAFRGSLIAVDASDDELLAELQELARRLGGTPRRVRDADRTLYHASAALSSNLVVALASLASDGLGKLGWSREEALAAVVPLLGGVVENLCRAGLPEALIGPIRRGDAATVGRHLAELEARGLAQAAAAYRILGMAALELALEAGLDAAAAEELRAALTG
jgi:predicted short-subunit dehydrogenase-like oxidoreductase (DUF2520 family)